MQLDKESVVLRGSRMSDTDTLIYKSDNCSDDNNNGLPDELEKAWNNVLEIVNYFLRVHDRFGFQLVAQKINPSIDDLLLSIKSMGALLTVLDTAGVFDGSELRKLLNAKQQIVHFEQASNALKLNNRAEYDEAVGRMKAQANF